MGGWNWSTSGKPLTFGELHRHNSSIWDLCLMGGTHVISDELCVRKHKEHPWWHFATKATTRMESGEPWIIPWLRVGLNLYLVWPWNRKETLPQRAPHNHSSLTVDWALTCRVIWKYCSWAKFEVWNCCVSENLFKWLRIFKIVNC